MSKLCSQEPNNQGSPRNQKRYPSLWHLNAADETLTLPGNMWRRLLITMDVIEVALDCPDSARPTHRLISFEEAGQPQERNSEVVEMDPKKYTGRTENPAIENSNNVRFGEIDNATTTEIDNIDRIDSFRTRSESFLIEEPTDVVYYKARWFGLIQLVLMNAIISWTVRY